jgi:hypothetical protein
VGLHRSAANKSGYKLQQLKLLPRTLAKFTYSSGGRSDIRTGVALGLVNLDEPASKRAEGDTTGLSGDGLDAASDRAIRG